MGTKRSAAQCFIFFLCIVRYTTNDIFSSYSTDTRGHARERIVFIQVGRKRKKKVTIRIYSHTRYTYQQTMTIVPTANK